MLPPLPKATTVKQSALLLALVLGAAYASVARAAPNAGSLSAELEVTANPECTTRADVMARVHARSPRVTFVENGGELAVSARFSRLSAGSVAGELTLVRRGAEPATRRVVAQSCAEAADAVALIIAVTLDPTSAERNDRGDHAATEGRPGASDTTPGEPRTKDEKNGPADGASRSPPAEPKEKGPSSNASSDNASSDEGSTPGSSSPLSGSARFGLLFAGQTFFGPTPGVMPGIALYATAGIDRPAPWSPALLLGFTHVWRSGIDEPGGTASFTLNALSLDACPLRFRSSRLEVRPCASLLGGRFAAQGTDTQNPAQERARPFWVLGAAGVVTVALVWRLEASARVGVGANLVRDSYEFSTTVFHTVPPVTLAASVGLGVRTP
jgi:hypothetical protein